MTTEQKREVKRRKLIVYQDDDIIVWEASNMKECILIARDYHVCTAKIGGNLYPRYRLRFHSTFFFIRFKHLTNELDKFGYLKSPLHFVIIDAQKDNIFQWGYTDNKENFKKYATPQEIIKQFPKFQMLFESGIIKNKPLKEEEKTVLNLQLE